MPEKDVKEIIVTLGLMTEAEKSLSSFYLLCGEKLTDDRAFWEKLSADEASHAESIAKMAGIVIDKLGEGFTNNRAFNRISINTFMTGINKNVEALKKGALAGRRIYFIVRDIEQSLLEAKYAEAVRTNDAGYTELLKKIMQETRLHHATLEEKIETFY